MPFCHTLIKHIFRGGGPRGAMMRGGPPGRGGRGMPLRGGPGMSRGGDRGGFAGMPPR